MNCPRCGTGSRVFDTCGLGEVTVRRRVCTSVECGQRWTTQETITAISGLPVATNRPLMAANSRPPVPLPLSPPPSLPSPPSPPFSPPYNPPLISPSPSPSPPSLSPLSPTPLPPVDEPGRADVLSVFAHYRTYRPRAHPKPQSKSVEWRRVRERFAEGYSADDLKTAIDGYWRSPFHLGENDRGQKYLDLELIVRSGSHVAKGLEYAEQRAGPVFSEREQKGIRATQSWIERTTKGETL